VLGLLSAGSIALLSGPPWRTAALHVPAGPLGVALALIVLSYLVWSVLARNPPPGTAAAQIGMSALDWYLTATVLFVLLPPASPFAYAGFVSACVLAHTLGMLSHVPGGAGVFEATMFTLLSGDLGGAGRAALSASLIAYRLVLLPGAPRRRDGGGRPRRCSTPGRHRLADSGARILRRRPRRA
jgi:uncharacterized membrane protein YbhN (UPF0104 family)